MCRLYSLFVCLSVLAACSPLHYSSEQVARTYSQEQLADSAFVRRILDQMVKERMHEQMEVYELSDGTFVREQFSMPDSTGQQHLVIRETSTFSRKKNASSQKTHSAEIEQKEQEDSVQVRQKATITYIEEQKKTNARTDGWMPWYVYLAAIVVAVLLGVILAARKRKWFKL